MAAQRRALSEVEQGEVESYRIADQVGFVMRAAIQRHTAMFAERMVEALTAPQFAALAKLREVGPCSQNRLGRLIHLDAATIKGVVDRLSARGFVLTADDSLDRRRRAVTLTERGRSVADAAILAARDIAEATLAPLAAEERETLLTLLRKIA